jgi:hypothetical protein
MCRPKGRLGPLLLVAAWVGLSAGCKEEYSDEPFGVLDISSLYDGGTSDDPTAGLPPTISPKLGYIDGDHAEYYDFGDIPVKRDPLTNVPRAALVQQMYFFFRQQDGYPLFSPPVREERDGTDWIRGGKDVVNPNPKDFCAGIPADKQKTDPCTEKNRAEKKKAYPVRYREKLIDPVRMSADYQRPIIDIAPSDRGATTAYTGLWEIVEVKVPAGYEPDSIKHLATLNRAVASGDFKKRATGKVINCPILDERTTVTRGITSRPLPRPRIELWYRRQLTFCSLANGWETLGNDQGQILFADSDNERVETFDVSRLMVGEGPKAESRLVVPVGRAYVPAEFTLDPNTGLPTILRLPDNLITRGLPKHNRNDPPGYTPIRWMWDFQADTDYQLGGVAALDAIDPAISIPWGALADTFVPTVRNIPTRGLGVACSLPKNVFMVGREKVTQCGNYVPDPNDPLGPMVVDARNDPRCKAIGLECNKNTCACDAPFVGYGQACGPGIAQCNPDPDKFSDAGYTCWPPFGGFCYLSCNNTVPNALAMQNMGKKPTQFVDSRCKELPGYTCLSSGAGPLCLKFCDLNVQDNNQCSAKAVMDKDPEEIAGGQICQDFGLEVCTWPDGFTPN